MESSGRTLQKPRIFSVSEITQDIKVVIEANFQGVWVEGEISNLRSPSSGHHYFTLKDANAQLSAVLFRGKGLGAKFKLQDGMMVLVFGDVDVYEKQGKYQLIVRKVEPKGLGALQLAFDQLKKKLFDEGLFDEARKKKIPLLPERIGIVTSPTGAAIRDILNILERRFANVHVIINPVRVQGDGAAREIASAVDEFNTMGEVDVIVVTRGGGSIEDLWAFNEEPVARAIARSEIPVISAVGHEIDFTIADFVADLRCPTPSAAAELVIGKKTELTAMIAAMEEGMARIAENAIQNGRNRIRLTLESRCFKDPASMIRDHQLHLDTLADRLTSEITHIVDLKKRDAGTTVEKLEALSPLSVLKRGYSVTMRAGKVVRDAGVLRKGDLVETRLAKGRFHSCVTGAGEDLQ
ncbi:MAG TPA: exodeoxyribonuclease VII large subunit [bacterium]|nr:exodeoxyribonuclease VII large subunit [bacterium]